MLTPFAGDVWYEAGPVTFLGMRLTATMTVVKGEAGSLLVHSPLAMTPERREAVLSLGHVAHLYAPNTFHHQWLGEWIGAFPEARVHAPEALGRKRSDLRIDRFHDKQGSDALAGLVDEVHVDGFMLDETVLVHRPSGTAIVADLVHNIGRPTHGWTRFYSRMMGFYDRVALSRAIRWTAFYDRAAARRSVDELLARSFDGLIVGHGAPIAEGARELLALATRFLPVTSKPKLLSAPKERRWPSPKPCG